MSARSARRASRAKTRRTARCAALALALLLAVPLAAVPATAAPPPERAFALLVASNASVDGSVAPLRYADDDAARFSELLAATDAQVALLAVLDAETQQTFPGLAARARPPTRAQLQSAMSELRRQMLQARQQGARTTFTFYFAGHGHVGADREGYVSLLDGRFSRSDLFREVIGRSAADVNHVIIDACNAYFLVNRRGERAEQRSEEAIRAFLAAESLARHPNTGVVLSTATAAESHEWARYRSGIFSHQLLSALWGSADVNGDRRVDYVELQAYIAAANLRVSNPQARLAIFARPPAANHSAALVDLRRLRVVAHGARRPAAARVGGFLEIPRAMQGHFYLEDDRGVRYLDFNKSAEQPLRLALLDRRYYYLRTADQEALIQLDAGGAGAVELRASELAFGPLAAVSRGSVEESFRRHLYAFPFGRAFVAGFAASLPDEPGLPAWASLPGDAPAPWYRRLRSWKWITLGSAVAALGLGATFQVLSVQAEDELEQGAGQITMVDAVALQRSARSRQTVAGVAFGLGGAAAASAIVLFALDGSRGKPSSARARAAPPVAAGLLAPPGGAGLMVSGSF